MLPHRPRRRRSQARLRPVLSHDERRVASYRFWPLDPERVWLANLAIGSPWWTGLFGDPRAFWALSYYVSNVIRFPERRSEVAKLRSEIEQLKKTVSVMAAVGT